jgi:MSHA biogenesis protein MshO
LHTSAAHAAPRHASAGFTLIEMVIVMVITGIIAGVVAQFIVQPVLGYLATVKRTQMVDNSDLALRRIGRDLRIALPNSVRVNASGQSLELITTSSGGRYATQGSGALAFGTTATSFNLVGPAMTLGSSQNLVFYNLGPTVPDANAYADNSSAGTQATSNRRTATNGAGLATTITMSSVAGLPVGDFAPPYRVLAVDQPVTYRCNLSAGTLTRYWNYGFLATQPDPPTGGSSAVLASGLTACKFSVQGTLVAARAAIVNLALTLSATTTSGTENVAMNHAVFVSNLP